MDLTAEEYPHLIADYFDLLRRGVGDQDYGKPVPNWRLPGPLAERPTPSRELYPSWPTGNASSKPRPKTGTDP